LAITGYDDAPITPFLYPALTSVRQPVAQVGRLVVDLLQQQIRGETPTQKGIVLSPELIVRASSDFPAPSGAVS
jgi:DNA-binding LacI/PurR family transcriptional regulator